jgi:hypothetical protein
VKLKFDLTCVPLGVKAKDLRAFLRAYRFVGWPVVDYPKPDPRRISRNEITEWFECNLADALVEKGLLEQTGLDEYRVTKLGNRLAPQSLSPRINRAKADQIVADLLDRIGKMNDDATEIYYVSKVLAFGSYIRNTDDLGDIDLVVYKGVKRLSHEEFEQRSHALRIKAAKINKRLSDPYFWDPRADFFKRVRNRSQYLSFHPEHDVKGQRRKVITSFSDYADFLNSGRF